MKKRKPKWTAQKIRAFRHHLDLTQGQFAARLSQTMSGQAVSRWEAGRGSPSPLYREKLDQLEEIEEAQRQADDLVGRLFKDNKDDKDGKGEEGERGEG